MTSSAFDGAKTVEIDGTSLAWCEQGEGEPVVFVHGGVSDLRVWANQLPVVGRSHRAISYSRRYARPNRDIDPDAPDPWLQHVDDLAALLRELGAAPAHLVGNSQGAFISLLAAIHHPSLVRSLVLEEPPVLPLFLSFPPRIGELLRLFATRPRAAIAITRFILATVVPTTRAFGRGDDERALETFLVGVLGERTFGELSEEQLQRARDNVRTLRAGMLHTGFPPIDDADVRGVRVPVLLLTGARSPEVLLRFSDRLAELLPVVERLEIPDASHTMHEENPTAVNAAICGFLARRRSDP